MEPEGNCVGDDSPDLDHSMTGAILMQCSDCVYSDLFGGARTWLYHLHWEIWIDA